MKDFSYDHNNPDLYHLDEVQEPELDTLEKKTKDRVESKLCKIKDRLGKRRRKFEQVKSQIYEDIERIKSEIEEIKKAGYQSPEELNDIQFLREQLQKRKRDLEKEKRKWTHLVDDWEKWEIEAEEELEEIDDWDTIKELL